MKSWLKISPHSHTGKLKGHEHTSYLPLVVLLLGLGLILNAYTAQALSAPTPGPESGSVSLTGTMPAKPPQDAPTIQVPAPGQHFTTSPITVSGVCPSGTIVEIFKNNIFGGSTACTNGHFSLQVDLLVGPNTLMARAYDALDQPSPSSTTIATSYDILPAQAGGISPLSFASSQLLLNTGSVFRGAFPDQAMSIPVTIVGGTPPYAANIQWGDNSNKVVVQNTHSTFDVSHTYTKPGTYQIELQATDSTGLVAFLSVASIVNGPVTTTASTASTSGIINQPVVQNLLVLWPLYTASCAVVISFWLGERREKAILRHASI